MEIIKKLLRFVAPYWFVFLLAIAVMLAGTGVNLLIPRVTKVIIDDVIPSGDKGYLVWMALAILGLAALRGVFTFLQRYMMEYVAQKTVYGIRNALYDALQRLPFSFYDSAQTGQLMSRVTSDVDTLRRFFGFGLIRLITSFVTFAGVLTIMLSMHWKLTLLSFVITPLMVYVTLQFSRKVRPAYTQVQEQMAHMTTALQENITGIRVVKSFVQEERENEKFKVENRAYFDKNIRAIRLNAFYGPLLDFLLGFTVAVILWYGSSEVIAGHLTVGEIVAFNSYLVMLLGPMRFLSYIVNMWQQAVACGERVLEILERPSEITNAPNSIKIDKAGGHIRFEDVWFSYDKENFVLKGLNIEAKPGEKVAILGATGSGKSSVINLIPRFYDPVKGRVTLDDIDLKEMDLVSLRQNIGMVSQDIFLFSTSIKENIAYGKQDATLDEIIEAAKAARAHDFIMGLPQEYDTIIGERGVGLSGGQRQRIAIARALLMDPAILILDESTSSVDAETERQIQAALEVLMEGRTSFIIAQRLSTVRNADKIMVLLDGQIAEEGTHESLIKAGGVYKEIYESQFRLQEAALLGEGHGMLAASRDSVGKGEDQ
jgi:ABC-type multidrug transport system fused ATPase/permease subunit